MKDFKTVELYECSNCQRLHRNIPSVEDCCLCVYCGEPKGHQYSNTDCEKCRDIKRRENFLKNLVVVEYDPNDIYCIEDRFFYDQDDILEYLYEFDSLEDWPEYADTTEEEGFSMNSEHILENALEEHHEDAYEQVVDEDEFHEFIKKWSEKQTLKTYWGNSKKAILISAIPGYEEMKAQFIKDHADD